MYSAETKRKNTVYGSLIFQLPESLEELANREMGKFGGIMKVAEYPELAVLAPTQDYEGNTWFATRRIIDQLDQVTFSRIRSE